jgi:CRP/FNR family transcriptional regulator, cyclic AMP receptor protein
VDDQTVATFLSEVELFKQLDRPSLRMLAGRAQRRVVPDGATIFVKDEPGDRMFVLVEGTVKLLVRFQTGEVIELTRHAPPASFGEVALLDGGRRTATAEAIGQVTLLAIDRADLMELLRAKPESTDALLHSLGGIIRRTTDQVTELMFLDTTGRVARRLLLLGERLGGADVQGVTQAELASMVGASRQTVNHVLNKLRRRGFIEMASGRVTAVRDRKKLWGLAKGLAPEVDDNTPDADSRP